MFYDYPLVELIILFQLEEERGTSFMMQRTHTNKAEGEISNLLILLPICSKISIACLSAVSLVGTKIMTKQSCC